MLTSGIRLSYDTDDDRNREAAHMTDTLNSLQAETTHTILHALRRLVGATRSTTPHGAMAHIALKAVAGTTSALHGSQTARLGAAIGVLGAANALEVLNTLDGFGGPLNLSLREALDNVATAYQTESMVLMQAIQPEVAETIAAIDVIVNYYEDAEVTREIKLSDGADPSKIDKVIPFDDHRAISYGGQV